MERRRERRIGGVRPKPMSWRMNLSTTPPGMFKYKVPETGVWIPTGIGAEGFFGFNDLLDAVKAHYKANGALAPGDLPQRMIDQMCQRLPPGYCRNDDRRVLSIAGDLIQSLMMIKQGTETILDWQLRHGGEVVAQAVADQRASVCAQCPLNGPPVGCPTCGGALPLLRQMVDKFTGQRKTGLDEKLHACYVCGCELRVKVWLPLPLLLRHLSPSHLARFPKPQTWLGFPGCWLIPHEKTQTPIQSPP